MHAASVPTLKYTRMGNPGHQNSQLVKVSYAHLFSPPTNLFCTRAGVSVRLTHSMTHLTFRSSLGSKIISAEQTRKGCVRSQQTEFYNLKRSPQSDLDKVSDRVRIGKNLHPLLLENCMRMGLQKPTGQASSVSPCHIRQNSLQNYHVLRNNCSYCWFD